MKKVTVKEAKGKKTVIIPLLPLQDGTFRHSVEAEVYGDIGIIPSRFVDGQFVLIHMTTFMSFNKTVPVSFLKDKPKLAAWAIEVQKKLKPEWDLLRDINPMDRIASAPLRDKIRDHCMKVKV